MIKNFLLFGLTFFAVLGCGKDEPSLTAVKGRVIDNNTGQPISDATVSYSYSDHDEPNGNPVYTYESLKTDSKGEFLFTLPSAGLTLTITKSEYMSKDVTKDSKHKIISGSTNDLGSLPLYPNDGVFKIVLFNKNGLYSQR